MLVQRCDWSGNTSGAASRGTAGEGDDDDFPESGLSTLADICGRIAVHY